MRVCSINGCTRKHLARGYCNLHYHRFARHGNAEAGRTYKGVPAKYLEEVVLAYSGDECLVWPFGHAHGYGRIALGGETHRVPRVVCERVNGPPPAAGMEAAHSCGNGAGGCCTPRHLRWATPAENQADRIEHGTSNRGERHGLAKLTEAEVLQIRALRGRMSQARIAAKFGVSQPAVSAIYSGARWSWLEARA